MADISCVRGSCGGCGINPSVPHNEEVITCLEDEKGKNQVWFIKNVLPEKPGGTFFSLIRQLFSLWGEIRGNRLWRGCDSLSEYDIVVVERKCTDSLSKDKTEDKGRDT